MRLRPIETLTKWWRKRSQKKTCEIFLAGSTTWDFANAQGVCGWCYYQEGDAFEATFVGKSYLKPIRGDKFLIRMRSGRVGVFQVYWFFPLFKDNRWKAKGCFIGYKDDYSRPPIRLGPSSIPLVKAVQAISEPSLEGLAASMSRPVDKGVRGPLPPSRQLPAVSCEPVTRGYSEGAV